MSVLYSLKNIAHLSIQQVGDTARLLDQLQQAGQTVPNSWVVADEGFQQVRQSLIAREPVFADWPQLLWQLPNLEGHARQQLAWRLRRPLQRTVLPFSLAPLLAEIDSPAVRLLPSLWLGDNLPSADFVQILGTRLCWADVRTIETTLKHLWSELVSACSLTYWSHWQRTRPAPARVYPQAIGVAIIIQAVESWYLSGTLTVRSEGATIQAIRGLPEAIEDSFPDTFTGGTPLQAVPPLTWQRGYQEQAYQIVDVETAPLPPETCLQGRLISQTAQAVMSTEIERALLCLASQLQSWTTVALKVEWGISVGSTSPQLLCALRWHLVPISQPAAVHASNTLTGRPASPGKAIGLALILRPGEPLPVAAKGQIIVASEVYPDWIPLLKTARAVVSEQGGLTCHAAILARELGLPAVVGVEQATQHLQTGMAIQLDGDLGIIELTATISASPETRSLPPQINGWPYRTELWLNLSQPDVAEAMAALPVAGIGLLRSEWLMMPVLNQMHPYAWLGQGQRAVLKNQLLAQLRPIVRAFFPRPVRYRSLDIRSNEFSQLVGAPPVEANPMLGVRGSFSYQQQPGFFRLELEALQQLQSEGYDNLHLLLPFVRTLEEVHYCQQCIHEVGLDQQEAFQLWIMAEVPSSVFLLPAYVAAGIQGIAIGTNDLTQLLLGVDRDQPVFAPYFESPHPAVEAAIAQLIQQTKALQIPSTLCGVAPAYHPEFVRFLVQQGITGISVDAAAIDRTASMIQQAEDSMRLRSSRES